MQPIMQQNELKRLSICFLFMNIIIIRGEILMKFENYDTWVAIGLNILYYRKEKGLTQMDLAERVNLSRNHIQRIETATRSCSLDTLMSIAEALEIPLKKLFEFRD